MKKSHRLSLFSWKSPILWILIALLLPTSTRMAAPTLEIIVEEPQLTPPYTTCPETYWYPIPNNRGHTAYLTLNTNNPAHSTNLGAWHPLITQSGYYQVQAYIPAHNPISWCTGQGRTIEHDTTQARYSIHHGFGVTTRTLSQYPLGDTWLDLGEYYFPAGSSGYVELSDLNGEAEFSTTLSFSAVRFTYTRATRAQAYLPAVELKYSTGNPPGDVGILQGQGFDACALPSISKMQTWWNESPYTFYALYLGGIHLPSFCAGLTADWVSAVHQQGWSFVPTWVGPQAPCSGYKYKMSSDPAVSYQQGRQEAEAASTRAAAVGLSNDNLGGTVIYYDMEVYGGADLACRQAAASFINGWVVRLGELGNVAGGYGARNSYVTDWAAIQHPPLDVWAASWYADGYDPNASVYGISWLTGLWTDHQRIRQYAGDHLERWGSIELNIDSDVADGLVAMPPSKPFERPIILSNPSIQDAGWWSREGGWLVSQGSLYLTQDMGQSWQLLPLANVQVADFLSASSGWVISATGEGQFTLQHTLDGTQTWEKLSLPQPPDDWQALQLHFDTPASGWILLRKMTSQVFAQTALLKTGDGGLTWSPSNDIPAALQPNTLPQATIHSGLAAGGLGWAVTSTGSCTGEKSTSSFTCTVEQGLWQTLDNGQTWNRISLPPAAPIKR